ncbi:MAG TPA: methionyl-tRNA formyltransferase, partial [Candidatus Latescibacteria bacterium]|nr:methionyl-tRNA formyltransferase [Candidatus Latescibacterota bacterium]
MVRSIKNLAPDLILVIGWYQFISKRIRSIPQLGCILLHDSLLPKYRGSATTNWPIIYGETETGVTLFYIDNGIDTGDIVGQKTVPIYPRDTAQSLLKRKDGACVELVRETMPLVRSGCAPRIVQ